MKKTKYDQELMDQYIALKCYDLSCEPVTEEERLIIAESYDFQAYCLNVAWNELLNEMKKSRVYKMIERLASKMSFPTITVIIGIALLILMCIDGCR